DDQGLRQLIWAPMSWSNPTEDDGATCLPPHQNIYEMCPEPYYGGGGMAIWPDIDFDDPLSPIQDAFTSFSSAIGYLQGLSDLDPPLSAYGNGIKIAVLAESAWLQEYTLFGQLQGGEHADLTGVMIEEVEDENGDVSEVMLDFSDPRATARGTAVLGVIAATNNGFGVTGMSHEAETTFFPTRSGMGGSSISRLEDAFLAALGYLGPGDVMVLAYEPDGGSILFDPASESLLELAAAQQGITIIVPAGDRQEDVSGPPPITGIENITVVGAATPGSNGEYLRWWSSNYDGVNDTVGTFVAGVPNLCGWGGGVVTTGGNANLTLLTVQDAIDIDTTTGEYTLSKIGKEYSFTNDFGANLDGTVAAAAQVGAAAANLQGFCKEWFGNFLKPEKVQDFMWQTALVGTTGDTPAGMNNPPPANAGTGGQQGIFTWDLDEVNAGNPRSVGRMPQLGRLLQAITSDLPDDDDFLTIECKEGLVDVAVITGDSLDPLDPLRIVEALTEAGDDRWLVVSSVRAGPGSVGMPQNNSISDPGQWAGLSADYPWNREITDIICAFQTPTGSYAGPGFSIAVWRDWLTFGGQFFVKIYDFEKNHWRDFEGDMLPADSGEFVAPPFNGTPLGFQRYVVDDIVCGDDDDLTTAQYFIRVMTQNDLDDHSIWRLDKVEVRDVLSPRPPEP
ncbi:MAG: hypothetical protein QF471_03425, partial [Phycisphaerales bacterium]|nr:hypothetical protein [Phycisphaerales bacterium]